MALPMSLHAQDLPLRFFKVEHKGFGVVTADSTYSLKFQFRMQNRAAFVSKDLDDLAPESFEFRVRRLRLKFEGFAFNPKLTYYIQLSFSRGDMDWRGPENSQYNNSPNVVRDAVIYYNPTKNLKLGFGQTKLPGNRQRVVSSGDQQFADRSMVNATFNIDRDFGFFAHLTSKFVILRGAITSGEGRNSLESPNSGLAYTGRIEFLPFGKFTGDNDYIEGDLERETLPKLSLASTYSYNDQAVREAGQLGGDLYEARGIGNLEFDALLKYNGWAWYNEYMQRISDNPITVNPDGSDTRYIYVGKGYLSQLSYLFRNNFEIAGRYSLIVPSSELYDNELMGVDERQVQRIEMGVTKYLMGHRVKVQGNIVRENYTNLEDNSADGGFWSGIFQIELGI